MSWDLKISEFQDLMYLPARDFQTTSGQDLIAQRIFVRLKIAQGSWVFDEDGNLGSNLHTALTMTEKSAMESISLLVQEALEPMSEEIAIANIDARPSEIAQNALDLFISYRPVITADSGALPITEVQSLRTVIPILGV